MTRGISEERLSKPVHNKINQIGNRFGRLLVIANADSYVAKSGKKKSRWQCKCDCGNEIVVMGTHLMSGTTKSCGCFQKDRTSETKSKHMMCQNKTYKTWERMLNRCSNPNHTSFKHYGGRGITICDRWLTFTNFYSDMGERPEGMTIDRTDNNKGYSPENCQWVTHKEQCKNRRSTRIIEFNGQKKCLTDWANLIGITNSSLIQRLNKWPIEIALTKPSKLSRDPDDYAC